MTDESSAQGLALIEAARLGDVQQVHIRFASCRRLPGPVCELGIALQVQRLLGAGVDAAYQDPSDGRSALIAAAAAGQTEVVRSMLAAGAPWNAFDRQANCAGDYALAGQHEECAAVLLNAGEILPRMLNNVSSDVKLTQQPATSRVACFECTTHAAMPGQKLCSAAHVLLQFVSATCFFHIHYVVILIRLFCCEQACRQS